MASNNQSAEQEEHSSEDDVADLTEHLTTSFSVIYNVPVLAEGSSDGVRGLNGEQSHKYGKNRSQDHAQRSEGSWHREGSESNGC